MADFAASTLEFSKAVMGSLERPVAVRRAGRWAAAAHDEVPVEDKPIIAVRRDVDIMLYGEGRQRGWVLCNGVADFDVSL